MASMLRGNEKVKYYSSLLALMNFSLPCFRQSEITLQSLGLKKSFQRVCAEEGVRRRRAGIEDEGITGKAALPPFLERYRGY